LVVQCPLDTVHTPTRVHEILAFFFSSAVILDQQWRIVGIYRSAGA